MLQAAGSPTTFPTTTTQGDRLGISGPSSCWVLPSVHIQLACDGRPASLITATCTHAHTHTRNCSYCVNAPTPTPATWHRLCGSAVQCYRVSDCCRCSLGYHAMCVFSRVQLAQGKRVARGQRHSPNHNQRPPLPCPPACLTGVSAGQPVSCSFSAITPSCLPPISTTNVGMCWNAPQSTVAAS